MDRLHLKFALIDLVEHGWVILESEDDAREVSEAARKSGRETTSERRPSPYLDRFYWIVTSPRRVAEEKVEQPMAKPVEKPAQEKPSEKSVGKPAGRPTLKRYIWKRS